METTELSFTCKARYFKLGTLNSQTRQIWFVLHGYGQLAQYFIQRFSVLEEKNICVIAPEGLSRFYLEDLNNRMQNGNDRVGATWMTKENRQMDIANYLQYLNTLYQQEIPPGNAIPITVLGFSQGAATASRWVTEGHTRVQRLILWAGIFPPDMDFETGAEALKGIPVNVVYGRSDPFLNDSRFAEMKAISSMLEVEPELIEFDGKHDIDPDTLLRFA